MLNKKYGSLKSGTDIRGIASEGVSGQNINLTDECIINITYGFALWLEHHTKKSLTDTKVAVGRDSRISGPHILDLVCKTLSSCGVFVIDCGLSSTPSMFMTTKDINCDASIQITASHHPFNRNGLKFFTKDGGLQAEDIGKILLNAQEDKKPTLSDSKTIEKMDFMEIYSKGLCNFVKKEVYATNYDKPLDGFKIVVDAGNGAGGFYAKNVLEVLGADISGSQFLNPDGMFPNHVPNPEDKEAMLSICTAVKNAKADLGVIFDTDVDRGAVVDQNGNEINRNRLVALSAAIALENNEGGTIVTDSVTSDGLKEFIESHLGGKHCRFKRGYKNVINKAIELNEQGINCPLAIETSGHAAMKENYFLDDGAYLCTKIIIKAVQLRKENKTLDNILADLKEPVESKELRIKITDEDFKTTGENILKNLEIYANENGFKVADDSAEGVRVSFDADNGAGFFLLRLSVHDPIMPLNIESDVVGGVDVIYNHISKFLSNCAGIDF